MATTFVSSGQHTAAAAASSAVSRALQISSAATLCLCRTSNRKAVSQLLQLSENGSKPTRGRNFMPKRSGSAAFVAASSSLSALHWPAAVVGGGVRRHFSHTSVVDKAFFKGNFSFSSVHTSGHGRVSAVSCVSPPFSARRDKLRSVNSKAFNKDTGAQQQEACFLLLSDYSTGNYIYNGSRLQQQLVLLSLSSSSSGSISHQREQKRKYTFPALRFMNAFSAGNSLVSNSSRNDISKEFSKTISPQQMRVLQQQAESNIGDARIQQQYLSALNANGEPNRVVQHVDKFKDSLLGVDEAVTIEYVKALCASGLIHQHSLSRILQQHTSAETHSSKSFKTASAQTTENKTFQQQQQQQAQLQQQQLLLQVQQQLQQLQLEDMQRRAVSSAAGGGSTAAAAKAASTAAVAGGNTIYYAGFKRFSPVRVIKWLCKALWVTIKACNRGFWGLLLSPVVAVFLLWSFLNDGFQAVQNSVKNLEGAGGLGAQGAGKKASEWVAGKIVKPEEINTTFEDVKGCEEVKKEVVEVVEYLKAPAKFTAMGARLPKGVLLQGPPGTGKTLIARAIAGEAGVPFIHASGSDFEEMYVGVGASRLRQLFVEARKRSPCILFIDEIDALGGRRTLTENKHHRQTLNQLLTELDGFKPSDGVTLICATNLAEALDPALTRPGRIDRIIHVPFPCKKERVEILEHYAAKMPLADNVDLDLLASLTSGMTGADLANLLNFAAIRAATDGKEQVTLAEVEESFDRLMVGNRRSSVIMKERERKVTAYHESGHALMCLYTPDSLPLHKATILFRGSALGVTWSVNREESFSKSLKEYLASLDVAMGGKAAEEIVFGKGNVTSGCFSDLQKATSVARTMVTGFGMGVEDSKAPMVVTGKDYSFLSDESKKRVDDAVQRLLDQSYERARALLTEKRDELERLAQALLEHETLSADEIRDAVAGKMNVEVMTERRAQKAAPTPCKEQKKIEGEEATEQQPPSPLLRSQENSVFKNSDSASVVAGSDNVVSVAPTATAIAGTGINHSAGSISSSNTSISDNSDSGSTSIVNTDHSKSTHYSPTNNTDFLFESDTSTSVDCVVHRDFSVKSSSQSNYDSKTSDHENNSSSSSSSTSESSSLLEFGDDGRFTKEEQVGKFAQKREPKGTLLSEEPSPDVAAPLAAVAAPATAGVSALLVAAANQTSHHVNKEEEQQRLQQRQSISDQAEDRRVAKERNTLSKQRKSGTSEEQSSSGERA